MTHPAYAAILQQFSQLEDPYEVAKHDLLALGITAEMIPDLIETILDEKYYSDDYPELEGYPQLFAYIALGQLKTPAAIDGLILGVKKWAHSDWFEWFCEGMPEIFQPIGSLAIPPLIELLQDKNLTFDARTSALMYMHPIAVAHPEERDRCVAAIAQELEQFADNDPELNGYLVMYLVADFKAVETAPIVETAYAAGRVDTSFVGDWDEAQVYLGLKPEKVLRRAKYFNRYTNKSFGRRSSYLDTLINSEEKRSIDTTAKNKAKRKQEKKARKKNRRK
jgi:hypothetical protein